MSFNPDNPDYVDPLDNEGAEDGQPGQRRYGGGKYASLEEFEKGYSESFREVERLRLQQATADARAAAAEARVSAIEAQLNQARQATPAPPAYLEVTEEGLPREQITGLVKDVVHQAVAEALNPLVQGANARTEMLRNAPDYAQHEVAVQQWLAANPQKLAAYNRIAAADPTAALDYAFTGYRSENPPGRLSPQDTAELNHSRTQAGLPNAGGTGRSPEGSPNGSGALNPRTLQTLLKDAQETGDFTKYLNYRLRDVTPPQFNQR